MFVSNNRMKRLLILSVHFFIINCFGQAPGLKSIVYDFDGFDIAQTNLPGGDFKNFDLTYQIAANTTGDNALGDRVLELQLNWASGSGQFGKGITKYIELDISTDHFNFFCYNPLSNYGSVVTDITITEDDNDNNIYDNSLDDKWNKSVTIPRSSDWQLISVPLNSFSDANTGGNGIFDAGYTGNGGKVFVVSLTFHKPIASTGPETYLIDMLCFSQGPLPTGNAVLELPAHNPEDQCLLGSLAYRTPADSVPVEVESLFSANNKLKYVNIFMPFASSGTVPSALPGTSVQTLINNGYRPIITWEMMYHSFAASDPAQPRLNQINNGSFNTYIDAFANKIKTYTDTVYIRLFHEFDGDWYPWCIAWNNQDPNELISAFKHIVDRFRAKGATNVKWIFSPNSAPSPNTNYNWFVNAYPGDSYVDIIGTSIYNHPSPGVPSWRTFRPLVTESYFYATKYFPNKPFFICEAACRERYNSEITDSQTKAEWWCQMDKDLQSYFNKTRAIIFFNKNKEHDWRVNSSSASLGAVSDCLWEDSYYSEQILSTSNSEISDTVIVYPNPFTEELNIAVKGFKPDIIDLYEVTGKKIGSYTIAEKNYIGKTLSAGIYILELKSRNSSKKIKIIKQ